MLVARLEIWNGNRLRTIGAAGIANVSSLAPVSDYQVVRVDDTGMATEGMVTQHDRARGPWRLLERALDVTNAAEATLGLSTQSASMAEALWSVLPPGSRTDV